MKRLMPPFYFLVILLVLNMSGCDPDAAAGTGTETSGTGSTETVTYSVTYYSNTADSGAAPVDSTNYEEGDTVTVAGNTGSLAKDHNTFAGWNTAADGNGTTYSTGSTFTMGTADVSLYAVWSEITYTVSFHANGGSGSMTDSTVSDYSDITLPANAFIRPNYSFTGWSTTEDGAVEYADGAVLSVTDADVDLYAIWQLDIETRWAEVVQNGSANSCLYGIGADDSGNIYTAGYQNGTNSFDYNGAVSSSDTSANNSVLIKYDDSGNGLWARVVNGGGAASTFKRLAVDSDGNIYAAGFQTGTDGITNTYVYGQNTDGTDVTSEADNSGTNAVIVKYTAAGNVLWAKTATGGGNNSYFNAVAVDDEGNVYAAGYQTGSGTFDYGNSVTVSASQDVNSWTHGVLVKYDSGGNAQWAKSETGKYSKTAFNGVTTDVNGDVYIAGTQMAAYNGTTISYGGVSLKSSGASVQAGTVIKYSAAGTPQWGKIISAIGTSAFYSVVADEDCNVYTSGYQYDFSTFDYGSGVEVTADNSCYNASVVKYDSTGTTLWAKIAVVSGSHDTRFYDLAVSSDNYIYTAGIQKTTATFTYGTGITAASNYSGTNSVIVRYNTDGEAEWAQTVNSGSGNSNFKGVIAADDGSILAAGYQDEGGTFDYGSSITAKSDTAENNSVVVKYY